MIFRWARLRWQAYDICFTQTKASGIAVMADLADFAGVFSTRATNDPIELARMAGRREMWAHIRKQIDGEAFDARVMDKVQDDFVERRRGDTD